MKNLTPDQKASKAARQKLSREMTKCACGSIARNGSSQCGRCAERASELAWLCETRKSHHEQFWADTATMSDHERLVRIETALLNAGLL